MLFCASFEDHIALLGKFDAITHVKREGGFDDNITRILQRATAVLETQVFRRSRYDLAVRSDHRHVDKAIADAFAIRAGIPVDRTTNRTRDTRHRRDSTYSAINRRGDELVPSVSRADTRFNTIPAEMRDPVYDDDTANAFIRYEQIAAASYAPYRNSELPSYANHTGDGFDIARIDEELCRSADTKRRMVTERYIAFECDTGVMECFSDAI